MRKQHLNVMLSSHKEEKKSPQNKAAHSRLLMRPHTGYLSFSVLMFPHCQTEDMKRLKGCHSLGMSNLSGSMTDSG